MTLINALFEKYFLVLFKRYFAIYISLFENVIYEAPHLKGTVQIKDMM